MVQRRRGALAEHQGDAKFFELRAIESGSGSGDVTLIAIEDGDLDSKFGDAFPTDGLRDRG